MKKDEYGLLCRCLVMTQGLRRMTEFGPNFGLLFLDRKVVVVFFKLVLEFIQHQSLLIVQLQSSKQEFKNAITSSSRCSSTAWSPLMNP